MSTIALDLDGTLVTKRWPGLGTWLPGAVEGVKDLMAAGHTCYIYSARVSPYNPDGSRCSPEEVFMQTQRVRNLLDDAGLHGVDIWTGEGKPFWDVLVDDKAVRFPGGRSSWRMMVPKVLAAVKDEDGFQRIMDAATFAE